MPRSGPSPADIDLLAQAAERGVNVSSTQLERWRGLGLVPRNVRRGLGRGRGSASVPADGALDALLEVAGQVQQGSKLLFGDPLLRAAVGKRVPAGSVKATVVKQFDQACAVLAAGAGADGDADVAGDIRFDAATRATRRGRWGGPGQLADWIVTGVEPDLHAPPRAALRDVLQFVVSGGRDVSIDALATAGRELGYTHSGDPEIDAIWKRLAVPGMSAPVDPDPDGEPVDDLDTAMQAWSLPAIRDRISALDEETLIVAAAAVLQAQAFQTLIMLLGMPRAADRCDLLPVELAHWAAPQVAQTMVADPVFRGWTRHWPAPAGTKASLDGLAFSVGMCAVTGMTNEVEAYVQRLLDAVDQCRLGRGDSGPND